MVFVARDLDYVILRLYDRRFGQRLHQMKCQILESHVYCTVINLSQNVFQVFLTGPFFNWLEDGVIFFPPKHVTFSGSD